MSSCTSDDDGDSRSSPIRTPTKAFTAESRPVAAVPSQNPAEGPLGGERSRDDEGRGDDASSVYPPQSHSLFVLASVASSLPQGSTAATSTRSTSLTDEHNSDIPRARHSRLDRAHATRAHSNASSPRVGSQPPANIRSRGLASLMTRAAGSECGPSCGAAVPSAR